MSRIVLIRLAVAVAVLGLAAAVAGAGIPVVSFLAKAFLFVVLAGIFAWLLVKAYQAFLWKVGRRLAFSYFLIGVLPIPMVALLALGVGYVLATFFLGHLYRDAAASFQAELVARAEEQLETFAAGGAAAAEAGAYAFDYYRRGKRVGGAGVAPDGWPQWLTEPPEGGDRAPESGSVARFVVAGEGDGAPSLAVAVEKGELGVTAVYTEDLAAAMRRESGLWVELYGPEAEAEPGVVTVQNTELRFRSSAPGEENAEARAEEKKEFFRGRARGDGPWDRPILVWPQLTGPLLALDTGAAVARRLQLLATGTPRMVVERLVSASAEQNLFAWIGLASVSAVLLTLYALAVLVAIAMIFGLSRAVNRLSRATTAVRTGDFSVRIPVRRKDQIGDLQRSFNQMASHLEDLVATSAQKEILEKELAIARELQESLLPRDLPQGEAVEFATLFQPSAAIGGDYFDILRLDADRLAVVIADVSGHGLSSGLRMAMLKAALLILVEQQEEPETILRRLDALVRADRDQHFFVTATLGLVDLGSGRLDLLNAGHPPTYLLRRGEVREILLPGSPLGYLGHNYGKASLQLEVGDLVVWLSDGFIEASDPAGDPFGYERVCRALAGDGRSPLEVRNRLTAAVEGHTAGRPADDDCTLVVMHYRATAGAEGEDAEAAVETGSSRIPSAE